MSRHLFRIGLLCASLALAACGADTPQEKLEEIKELQAKNYPMSDEQKASVEKALDEGRALLEAGKSDEAGKSFDQAIKVLKLARDADIYNKSE